MTARTAEPSVVDALHDPRAVRTELKPPPGEDPAPGEQSERDQAREDDGDHVHRGNPSADVVRQDQPRGFEEPERARGSGPGRGPITEEKLMECLERLGCDLG